MATRHPRPPAHPKLAAAMAARGISNQYLAEQMDPPVTASTISSVIRGAVKASPSFRARVVAVLDVPEDELFSAQRYVLVSDEVAS